MIFKHCYEHQSFATEPEIIISLSWGCFVVVTVQSLLRTWMITNITIAAEGMPFNQNSHTDVSYYADPVLHEYKKNLVRHTCT